MDELEYYKSLVSDEEVISALIKDSKAREGEVEKSRVRPNLQFFQRTVSNLVSSNNRIAVNQEKSIAKEKEKNRTPKRKEAPVRRKLPIEYIREILSNKIEFVNSTDDVQSTNDFKTLEENDATELRTSATPNSSGGSRAQKKVFKCKKTPFQQIREILTNNVDKNQPTRSNSSTPDSSSSRKYSNSSKINFNKDSKETAANCSSGVKKSKERKYNASPEVCIMSTPDISASSLYSGKNKLKRTGDPEISCSSKGKKLKKWRHTGYSKDSITSISGSSPTNSYYDTKNTDGRCSLEIKKSKSRQCSESFKTSIISRSDTSTTISSSDSDSDISIVTIDNTSINKTKD